MSCCRESRPRSVLPVPRRDVSVAFVVSSLRRRLALGIRADRCISGTPYSTTLFSIVVRQRQEHARLPIGASLRGALAGVLSAIHGFVGRWCCARSRWVPPAMRNPSANRKRSCHTVALSSTNPAARATPLLSSRSGAAIVIRRAGSEYWTFDNAPSRDSPPWLL